MGQDSRSEVHQCGCLICQQHPYSKVAHEHRAINRMVAELNEKNRRRFVGVLALQWEPGGVQRLIEITGLSRNTICRGLAEVQHVDRKTAGRVRRTGGGRLTIEKNSQPS